MNMENKPGLKKCIVGAVAVTVLLGIVFVIAVLGAIKSYNRRTNEGVAAILIATHEKYPEVSYNELMGLLEGNAGEDNAEAMKWLCDTYGIDVEEESFIEDNSDSIIKLLMICAAFFVVEALIIIICFLVYDKRRDKDINEITRCVENINHKIYHFEVDKNTEDELSILKNEIYKTMVMLKEEAENSKLAKKQLKDSLSDISHQLKTPLTAIAIKLDNIVDEPDMDDKTRQRFVREIRREVANISFMVQSLLKLSKLDSNTVNFINEDIELFDIVKEAISNISALSDLKDVKINITKQGAYTISCDRKLEIF